MVPNVSIDRRSWHNVFLRKPWKSTAVAVRTTCAYESTAADFEHYRSFTSAQVGCKCMHTAFCGNIKTEWRSVVSEIAVLVSLPPPYYCCTSSSHSANLSGSCASLSSAAAAATDATAPSAIPPFFLALGPAVLECRALTVAGEAAAAAAPFLGDGRAGLLQQRRSWEGATPIRLLIPQRACLRVPLFLGRLANTIVAGNGGGCTSQSSQHQQAPYPPPGLLACSQGRVLGARRASKAFQTTTPSALLFRRNSKKKKSRLVEL